MLKLLRQRQKTHKWCTLQATVGQEETPGARFLRASQLEKKTEKRKTVRLTGFLWFFLLHLFPPPFYSFTSSPVFLLSVTEQLMQSPVALLSCNCLAEFSFSSLVHRTSRWFIDRIMHFRTRGGGDLLTQWRQQPQIGSGSGKEMTAAVARQSSSASVFAVNELSPVAWLLPLAASHWNCTHLSHFHFHLVASSTWTFSAPSIKS